MAANESIKPEVLDQVILFANFSAAAYEDADIRSFGAKDINGKRPLGKSLNELRHNRDGSQNKTDTQASTVRWNNDIVLAFRGTEGKLADWWTDLNGTLVENKFGGGKVHNGFNVALDSIYASIERYIGQHRDLNPTAKSRLFLCGHSLGGALALTCAARLVADPKMPTVAGVFTYGAPRVGDEVYAKAYKELKVSDSTLGERTHMFVAKKDPVAHVAPYSYHYRHPIEKQYGLEQGNVSIRSLDEERNIEDESNRMPGVQTLHGLVSHLTCAITTFDSDQHSMKNSYLPQLRQARELQKKG